VLDVAGHDLSERTMKFSVYVGPYVVVSGLNYLQEQKLLKEFRDVLMNGRGEAGVNDTELYVIPTENISKHATFRQVDSLRVPMCIKAHDIPEEMQMMKDLSVEFIAAVKKNGGRTIVEYGVVCCER
jgi:hypothetical protein